LSSNVIQISIYDDNANYGGDDHYDDDDDEVQGLDTFYQKFLLNARTSLPTSDLKSNPKHGLDTLIHN